jgi:hypothetical protein
MIFGGQSGLTRACAALRNATQVCLQLRNAFHFFTNDAAQGFFQALIGDMGAQGLIDQGLVVATRPR